MIIHFLLISVIQNGSLRSELHLVLVFCKSRKIIWDLPDNSPSVKNSSNARNDDFDHFSIKEEMKTFFGRDVFVIFKLFGSSLKIWIFWWFWRFHVVEGMNVKIFCKVLIEVHRVHWLVEGILKYILNKVEGSLLKNWPDDVHHKNFSNNVCPYILHFITCCDGIIQLLIKTWGHIFRLIHYHVHHNTGLLGQWNGKIINNSNSLILST